MGLVVRFLIGASAILVLLLVAPSVLDIALDIALDVADPAEMRLTGTIVDPAGAGIPARLIVLRPGTAAREWGGDAGRVLTVAQADTNGAFETEPRLRRGETYAIVVEHERFATAAADNISVARRGTRVDLGTIPLALPAAP